MPVKINATGGGSVTVAAASTASDFTLTLPAVTDTVVGLAATQTLTNKTLTSPTIGGTPVMNASVITSGTANTASGTSVDFTSIPSWVKRVTVTFFNVSTTGTNNKLIQLIHSGGTVVSSGYRSAASRFDGSALSEAASTAGFLINSILAADDHYGSYILTNVNGNVWSGIGSVTYSGGFISSCGGVSIASTLTGIRITTTGGTDTFDAGTINILYE